MVLISVRGILTLTANSLSANPMVAMMTFSVLLPQDNVGVSIITTLKLEEQEQTENQAVLQLVKPFEISNNFSKIL